MDKDMNYNHTINLIERKNINITGVKKIDSFDSEEFLIESVMGYIVIKGENLEIVKLDTYQGSLNIKGKINGINYMDTKVEEKGESLLSRLFK